MPRRTFLSAIALLFGCVPRKDRLHLGDKPDEVRAEILAHAPVGTPISDAWRVMEANGFECGLQENADFSANGVLHQHLDYLYCDLQKSAGLATARRWQIAIVRKNDKVVDVLVSTGLTGP